MKKRLISIIISVFLLAFLSGMFFACKKPIEQKEPTDEIKIDFANGQTSAIFNTDDIPLRAITGNTPNDGEYIQKDIKVIIENSTELTFSFKITEGEPIEGLTYCVNGGDANDFIEGEFFYSGVESTQTEFTFTLRIWLSANTPESVAGQSLVFSIVALAK